MLNFPDAPANGATYQDWTFDGTLWTRSGRAPEPAYVQGYPPNAYRNGAAVLTPYKTQIELAGLTTINVPLKYPNVSYSGGTDLVRFSYVYFGTAQLQMIWSADGTTWPAPPSDAWRYAGMYHNSAGGFANMVQTNSAAIPLHYGVNANANNPCMGEYWIHRASTGRGYIKSVSETATNNVITMLIRVWSYNMSSGFKAIRLFTHDGSQFQAGSLCTMEEFP